MEYKGYDFEKHIKILEELRREYEALKRIEHIKTQLNYDNMYDIEYDDAIEMLIGIKHDIDKILLGAVDNEQ